MKRYLMNIFCLVLLMACRTVLTLAQGEQTAKPTTASPPAAAPSFRAEFLRILEDTEKKMVSLAEAIPQDKYSWRPMEGVRSVSEVYMHMALSNFRLPQFLGMKAPVEISPEMEKITDKAKVVEMLRQSFQHVRQAATNTPEADWNKTVTFSGRNINTGEAFIRAAFGMREHLGQSIAYARMNRVVPPWTAAREAQQRK